MSDIFVPPEDYTPELMPGKAKDAAKAASASRFDSYMVPIDNIVADNNFNVRVHDTEYEAHIERLVDSIVENGFYRHMPLPGYAGKQGDRDVIYLVGGFSRFEAAKRAVKRGFEVEQLPIVLKPQHTDAIDLLTALAVDNTGKPLRPFEMGLVLKRMAARGLSEREMARRLGRSAQYVNGIMYLMGLPQELKDFVTSGQVPASRVVELARKHGEEAADIIREELTSYDPDLETPKAPETDEGREIEEGGEAARERPRRQRARAGAFGRVTPRAMNVAIDHAISVAENDLEGAIAFLRQWRNGDKEAMAIVEDELKKPKVEKPAKSEKPTKGERKRRSKKAEEPAEAKPKLPPITDESVEEYYANEIGKAADKWPWPKETSQTTETSDEDDL